MIKRWIIAAAYGKMLVRVILFCALSCFTLENATNLYSVRSILTIYGVIILKANKLYCRLEEDFISEGLTDVWTKYMGEVTKYISDNFKERDMGVVCDFAEEINGVYSAVFPTDEIMKRLIENEVTDAMLFVHHPAVWDIRKKPNFSQMNPALLESFKKNRISIYNLHTPLDNYGDYSTSKSLANALEIEVEKPFSKYNGGLLGVIGHTSCKTVYELNDIFSKAVGHNTKLYLYGNTDIENGRVAIAAGGSNVVEAVSEALENNVNVFITGITACDEKSFNVHKFEEENHINVLGGTHYSTEKFACIRICDYFKKIGIASTFIEDKAIMEDM